MTLKKLRWGVRKITRTRKLVPKALCSMAVVGMVLSVVVGYINMTERVSEFFFRLSVYGFVTCVAVGLLSLLSLTCDINEPNRVKPKKRAVTTPNESVAADRPSTPDAR